MWAVIGAGATGPHRAKDSKPWARNKGWFPTHIS